MRLRTLVGFMLIICWGFIPGGVFSQEAEKPFFRIEEMTVQAGEFTIVGDLYIPLRGAKHPADISKRDFVTLSLDYGQMGVGGDDSWGAQPHLQYKIRFGEYIHEFVYGLRLRPFREGDDLAALSKVVY